MKPVVYDAGALIAADRNDRRFWAEHRARLEMDIVPSVPSPIVAQVSRSPKQAPLRQLLRGCEVLSLDESDAHRVGALLAKSKTDDISDAAVVVAAIPIRADIVSSDRDDIEHLLTSARAKLQVIPP
jgi:hypothetical protein